MDLLLMDKKIIIFTGPSLSIDDAKQVLDADYKPPVKRGDINLVYVFEGSYTEGWQGDYIKTYANLYLWEDGIFTGKVGDTAIKGFWYNDSNDDGEADCLRMVSNYSHYEDIICDSADGFYDYITYVYLGFSWGQRSIDLSGYLAYEPIAIAVDTDTTEL